MKRNPVLRSLIAAAMAVAFLSIVVGGASAADNTASITVHLRQCNGAPTTDYFTDCHGNGVPGIDISIASTAATTDASGNATVGSLAAGDYGVSAGVPGASSTFSYCSSDLGRAESFNTGDFTVDKLAVGELVTCDVYGVVEPTVPDTGSLTIHKRVCAAGQPTTDIFTDCHGDIDGVSGVVKITADGTQQTVGASGNVTWTGIPNGTINVTEDVSVAGAKSSRVFCSTNDGSTSNEVASTNGNFSVTINGDDVICDSYTLLSTGSTGGNGTSGNGTGNSTSGNGTSGNGTSGGGTTLPNTGVGPRHSGNNAYFAMIALLFVAVSGFGVARTVRARK